MEKNQLTYLEAATTLRELGISDDVLGSMRRQGWIVAEKRGRREIFKLRYRILGRQHVIYLGTDRARAAKVASALQVWKSGRVLQRRIKDQARRARHVLRSVRKRVEKEMHTLGFS